ncbi:hypothetical protein OROGR_008498 [Orobanche gracilis]
MRILTRMVLWLMLCFQAASVPISIAEAIHVNIVRDSTSRLLMYSAQFIIDHIPLVQPLMLKDYDNISSTTLESGLGFVLRHGIVAASTYQLTGGYDRSPVSHTSVAVIDDIHHVSTKVSLEETLTSLYMFGPHVGVLRHSENFHSVKGWVS